MSYKRAAIRRARKEAQRMGKLPKAAIERMAYDGQEIGKMYAVYAMCHVMYKEFGWKTKRCEQLIARTSDDTHRTWCIDTADVIAFAYADRVNGAMPELDADTVLDSIGINDSTNLNELVGKAYKADARNTTYRQIVVFLLDTLGDPYTYNFGNKRLDKVLAGMAEQYTLMQSKSLKWFDARSKAEVGIQFSDVEEMDS